MKQQLETRMLAKSLQKTGLFKNPKLSGPVHLRPETLSDLRKCLEPGSRAPLPIRPQGAGTAATDCNTSASGSILHMRGLNRIRRVDADNGIVVVEAGIRVATLVACLAEDGLELFGGYESQGRTVGGAIAAPCFGPCIGDSGSFFSSHVLSMRVITPNGKMLNVDMTQKNLLAAFRMSLGLLGVIYEVTLQVRPIRVFRASHRRVDMKMFSSTVDTLVASDVGFKFYLMPYRDRVYLDLRRYESDSGTSYNAPWKLKDWGESTVLPHVFKSLNRIVPIDTVKYRLIDSISEATHGLVNTRFVHSGSNSASQLRGGLDRDMHYSTWCFPAANFSMVAIAYKEFCESLLETSRYRCDLPAVGYRLNHDVNALLSPSFDETMIALTTASTQLKGWEDFVIDLAEFAEKWGGTPLISQSRALRAEYVIQTYSRRLDFFRQMRRKLDPDNRLLSPFLAQFAQ
jgi:FAD/FMN-containing dehydrogenase